MRAPLLAAILAVVLVGAPVAHAQDSTDASPATLTIGSSLPDAERVVQTATGTTTTLVDAAGPAGLVVVFWSNTCPWGDRYAARVADLVAAYAPAGFGVVLVSALGPDRVADASVVASRDELSATGLTVPYLLDTDGALGAAFGVKSAPHAFLFGPARTLLYDGAIDDSPSSADRVERPYLREALDRSVASLPVEVQRTQAFGCRVRPPSP